MSSIALIRRLSGRTAVSTGVSSLRTSYRFCTPPAASPPSKIKITVHSKIDDRTKAYMAPVGMTLMESIVNIGKFDMEAACDGTCACSTCHVIFAQESYERLPGEPTEDEMDMLDLAPAVSRTSRLSCQVTLTQELDEIELTIPDEMENQMS